MLKNAITIFFYQKNIIFTEKMKNNNRELFFSQFAGGNAIDFFEGSAEGKLIGISAERSDLFQCVFAG